MYTAPVVVCLTAMLLAADAHAAVLEEFSVEDWSGLALSDDATGALASCAVFSRYHNGATLLFIRHLDGGWVLSVVHEDWALAKDSVERVRIIVDRQPPVEENGVALAADQIGVSFADDDPLLAQIRRGKLLSMHVAGKEYGFELSNSGKALKAAKDCTEREFAAGDGLPPRDAGAYGSHHSSEDAAASPPGASGLAPVGELLTFGDWVVTRTDNGDGGPAACTAFGVHGDDQLILSYRPDVWEFGLHRGSWSLDPNQTYYLWYHVDAPLDGPGVVKRPVEAVEPRRILFEVSAAEDIIARMEGGRFLHVELHGFQTAPQAFAYPLDRAAEAFAAVRECARGEPPGA